jgi:hypothetical protein
MTLYIGKSGEFYAAAHLLRLGLNAMPMSVDSGIDLIGHLSNRYGNSRIFQFQVKSTNETVARIKLTRAKFNSYITNAINLIVVFWHDPKAPFAVVFPPRLLRMMTSGGYANPAAPIRADRDPVRIVIESHGGRVFVRNRSNEYTLMVNRFDLAEPADIDTTHLPEYATWGEGPCLLNIDLGGVPVGNPNTLGEELQAAP